MLKGLLSYIAIVGFTLIWVLGWLCICWLIGAFFDLPMATTAIVGATLGPLGLVAVLVLGILSKSQNTDVPSEVRVTSRRLLQTEDPFA
jgi:Kef-type K+ transport system membrane component KefB